MILFKNHLGVFKILSMVVVPEIRHNVPKHLKMVRPDFPRATPALLRIFFLHLHPVFPACADTYKDYHYTQR